MPKRLPVRDLIGGLLKSVGRGVQYWLHYTLVAVAWLGVVPLTACRIYRCLFTGSVSSLLTLPLDMLSTENLVTDCFQGCFVVACTLCAFISLVWLREQILHGGDPDWLDPDNPLHFLHPQQNAGAVPAAAAPQPAAAGGGGGGGMAGIIGGVLGNRGNQAAPANQEEEAADLNEQPAAAAENPEEEVEGAVNNGAQDDNWNPIEWDRAAEELTWEKLLGLDGSLVFLEHVFWVVSLNTLFILVFAFCPYHIGHFTIVGLKAESLLSLTQFDGLITTLIGYFLIAISLVVLHCVATLARFRRSRRILGLCYVVVKVSLLVVVEIGLFPLVCGWWLDVCSLSLFDASLKDRVSSFRLAPSTSMFIHWLVGMVYVFYFASFILLLREVLRPGVLWFLRNMNDPDFNPIQEMIHLPMLRHMRRFLASMVIFGSTVLLMLWLPVKVMQWALPGFLPYHVLLSSDAPVSELSLELLLLQVVLPALLEQGHTRTWLKNLVRGWCVAVAWLLDLRSYLLGDVPLPDQLQQPAAEEEEPAAAAEPEPQGLGEAHQAMMQPGGPVGFQPYARPLYFSIRLLLLLAFMGVTLFASSLISLILPVSLGRQMMGLWMGDIKVHELYTAACGLYTCWVTLRAATVICNWAPQGSAAIISRIKEWGSLGLKAVLIATVLIGLVPLLLGLLVELSIVMPITVPLDQTPIFYIWQDWALGVLHAKIICALTMMGPQWWLKRVIEQIYNQGLRNLNLWSVLTQLCVPLVGCLGFWLAAPYVIAKGIVPALGVSMEMQNLVWRRIYPLHLTCILFAAFITFQAHQFKRLYEHIKNDKYLVGQQLVNYNHAPPPPPQEEATDAN
ncbi:hypothetical protein CAPTEDRAFT_168587 [Capitella teleta]|uniref:RING-type E3 ubiquitin transferase n=1 Tax=Capitella teleta TaxID=283909 RepID=R7T7E7_CAPTE|nr:hypothetical protein CAPTEDRAFT_168587 [Capitella teleta]|eukprot:ELT87335.1 hypothetical protein CAPTEDRAFT_168587 [Capitella teleta]